MRWKHAMGREVVDTRTAETVGKIGGFVVEPADSKIAAVIVGSKIVSWSDAGGIGPDALMVNGADVLTDPSSDTEAAAVDGKGDPISKTVFTEDGFDIGTLVDIVFDPESGAIDDLVLADDDIAGARLMGIGSFAVVVASAASPQTEGDLRSLTKDELYERAKNRDLEGRSTMSKKELIAALS